MTDRSSAFSRGSSDLSDTAKWINVSEETVPAYGVVQFRSNFVSGYNQADKPDGSPGLFFVNGPLDVPTTKHGESLVWNHARLALIDGSPTVGTVVGPVTGSWKMEEGGTGFIVMHQPVDGVGAVVQLGGGAVELIHGIVVAHLTRGYYTVRLSDWSAEALPDTYTEDTLCEILAAQVVVEGETYTNCTADQTLPEFVETEDETTLPIVKRQTTAQSPTVDVTAFHRASIFVPLALWSEVLMVDKGDKIGATKIYQIVDGFQEHLIGYDKQFECCELTGEWKLVQRTPYIFAAIKCDPDACEPCPTV